MRAHGFTAVLGVLMAATFGGAACAEGSWPTGPVNEVNADVFMVRANINPNPAGIPDYKYFVGSVIDDSNLRISSASLTGMGNTSGYALNISTKKWWDDPGSRYSTQKTPVFPMNYTIYIKYKDNRDTTVSRTVSSWSDAK